MSRARPSSSSARISSSHKSIAVPPPVIQRSAQDTAHAVAATAAAAKQRAASAHKQRARDPFDSSSDDDAEEDAFAQAIAAPPARTSVAPPAARPVSARPAPATAPAPARPTSTARTNAAAAPTTLGSPRSAAPTSTSSVLSPRASSNAAPARSAPSLSSPRASSGSASASSSSAHQMASLLSFLEEHEQETEKDQQMINTLSRASTPRATATTITQQQRGPYESAFASSTRSSPASTQVAGATAYTRPAASGPRGHAAPAFPHSHASAASSLAPTLINGGGGAGFDDSALSSTGPLSFGSASVGGGGGGVGSNSFVDIKSKMMALKHSVAERDDALRKLQARLDDQTALHAAQLARESSQHSLELASQKSEYESTLTRHQSFIESLLSTKSELADQVESLGAQIASMDAAFQAKMDTALASQESSFRSRLDAQAAGEKARQAAWTKAQTKAIKAATVRAMEPELTRLIDKNKRELREAEEAFARQLKTKLEDSAADTERMLQQLRASMSQEREAALEAERDHAQSRSAEALARSDQLLADQRARFLSELESQRASLLAEKSSLGDQGARAADERIRRMRENHAMELAEQQRRHETALANIQTAREAERVRSNQALADTLSAQLRERELALRSQLRAEQGQELDLVVTRMASEAESATRELQSAHAKDVQKLQSQVESLQARVTQAESMADRAEGEKAAVSSSLVGESRRVASLVTQLRERDEQLEKARTAIAQFEQSNAAVRSEIEAQFAARIGRLTHEREAMQQSLREERDRGLDAARKAEKTLADRLSTLESRHAAELASLNLRVRHALEQKDLLLSQLKREMEEKDRRMHELTRTLG